MSQVHNSRLSRLEIVLKHLRRAELRWDADVVLTGRNRAFMLDLLSIFTAIWLDVSHYSTLINARWVNYLCSEPMLALVDFLKEVDYCLIAEKQSTLTSFKHWISESYGEWGRQIMAPLVEEVRVFFAYAWNLQRIRTALRFITRANLPDQLDLEERAFDAWITRATRNFAIPDVAPEEAEWRRIFPRTSSCYLVPEDRLVTDYKGTRTARIGFLGRFGPGRSAALGNLSCTATKYASFTYDAKLEYFARKVRHSCLEMPRVTFVEDANWRMAELSFAPKWLDTPRVISTIPAPLMYYQLGGFDWILSIIGRSPWQHHINLERDELNKMLALEGSLGGGYSTIDLSNASDCVSYELVRRLCHRTCLRELLVCTREAGVLYKGEIFKPTYYAPMGSGLCFPVECIVFASVVSAVMRRHNDTRAWRVYGDDIIVPDDRYVEVVDRLEQLGFEVNRAKSFSGSQCFRESCGGDYFSGDYVRPVYISRFWTGFPSNTEGRRHQAVAAIEKTIALINSLGQYKLARSYCIRRLMADEPRLLFSSSLDKGIASDAATNYHLKGRRNVDLQADQFKCVRTLCVQQDAGPEYEDIRLYEWLRQNADRRRASPEQQISIGRTSSPTLKVVWDSPGPGWIGPRRLREYIPRS